MRKYFNCVCITVAWKSVSPGSTSPVAMSTDAMTGAKDLREKRTKERRRAPRPVENVPSAGVWVRTCPYGWVVSLLCMWTPELPLMLLCRVATSARRGQPDTGQRHHCPMGRTPSDLSAPSASLPSAHLGGHGSSSRALSTSYHFSATTIATTLTTGSCLGFIHVANVDQNKKVILLEYESVFYTYILHVQQHINVRSRNVAQC